MGCAPRLCPGQSPWSGGSAAKPQKLKVFCFTVFSEARTEIKRFDQFLRMTAQNGRKHARMCLCGAAADPREGRGGDRPLNWGPKKSPPNKNMARPKNTHICKPPFACHNALKLTYSNLEFPNFPGEDPRTPLFKGRGG